MVGGYSCFLGRVCAQRCLTPVSCLLGMSVAHITHAGKRLARPMSHARWWSVRLPTSHTCVRAVRRHAAHMCTCMLLQACLYSSFLAAAALALYASFCTSDIAFQLAAAAVMTFTPVCTHTTHTHTQHMRQGVGTTCQRAHSHAYTCTKDTPCRASPCHSLCVYVCVLDT